MFLLCNWCIDHKYWTPNCIWTTSRWVMLEKNVHHSPPFWWVLTQGSSSCSCASVMQMELPDWRNKAVDPRISAVWRVQRLAGCVTRKLKRRPGNWPWFPKMESAASSDDISRFALLFRVGATHETSVYTPWHICLVLKPHGQYISLKPVPVFKWHI